MKKIFKTKKAVASFLMVAVLCVGVSLAFMTAASGTLTNLFKPGSVTTTVEESTSGSSKQVWVKNDASSVPVYIRARINVGGVAPGDWKYGSSQKDDKVVVVKDSGKWVQNGDWWYYTEAVAPDSKTDNLIKAVYVGGAVPSLDANNFTVTIYHESVAAVGGKTYLTAFN